MARSTGLEEAALQLEPRARARLAARLIESLDSAEELDREEIEELWLAEAEERCRQIGAGEVELLSAGEVLERPREEGDID